MEAAKTAQLIMALHTSSASPSSSDQRSYEHGQPSRTRVKREPVDDNDNDDEVMHELSTAAVKQRRMIRNKESAAQSRQRKKTYISTLECQLQSLNEKCQTLESQNNRLLTSLLELETKNTRLVDIIERISTGSSHVEDCSSGSGSDHEHQDVVTPRGSAN